jgi:hypothetical protein
LTIRGYPQPLLELADAGADRHRRGRGPLARRGVVRRLLHRLGGMGRRVLRRGQERRVDTQDRTGTDSEGGARGGPHDAVNDQVVAGLEGLHRSERDRSEIAVCGYAEALLDLAYGRGDRFIR